MQATLVYIRNPFNPLHDREVKAIHRRRRIDKLAPKTDLPFVCMLNGEPLLRANKGWHRSVKDGDVLAFVTVPQGGGGGSNPLKLVLVVALAIAAPQIGFSIASSFGTSLGVFGSTSALGSFIGGAIGFVGNALINSMFGSPKPPSSLQAQSVASPSPTYSISAQGNRARLLEAIPVMYGRNKIYPDFAADPYQEYIGNDQYLYMLFCLGQGDIEVESVFIEDTPITSFPGVQLQIVKPGDQVSLFPVNVVTATEVSGQELLPNVVTGPFVANPAGTLTNKMAVDIVLPQGLFYANDAGGLDARSVSFKIEIRSIDDSGAPIGNWQAVTHNETRYYSNYWSLGYWTGGTGFVPRTWNQVNYGSTNYNDHTEGASGGTITVSSGSGVWALPTKVAVTWRWVPFGSDPHPTQEYVAVIADNTITAATNTAIRRSYTLPVAKGRYEVRLTRTNAKSGDARESSAIAWAGLRTYLPGGQDYGDLTMLAVKLKASNSLSSQSSRRISVIGTRMLPTWNGTAWTEPQATRSIAWAAADALKAQYGGRLTDSQIALDELLALDAIWAARSDKFDFIFDSRSTVFEALTTILRAGRAKPFQQGAIWHFARDQKQTLPVAMFNMRNIARGSVKVQYLIPTDETADSATVEYWDETVFAYRTVDCALPDSISEKPAKIRLSGVTNRNHAWREGMYELATNRYRRQLISLQTEMDGYIPTFADLVSLSHDRTNWGQSGEILSWDAASLTAIVSEPLDFSAGGTHYIGLRKRDGSYDGPFVITAGTDAYHGVLASAPSFTPYTGTAEERTYFQFGPAQGHRKLALVTAVRPRSMSKVELLLANEDDAVHAADQTGGPAEYSQWNLPAVISRPSVQNIIVRLGGTKITPLAIISWDPAAGANSYVLDISYDAGISYISLGSTVNPVFQFPAPAQQVTIRIAALGITAGAYAYYTGNPMADEPIADVTGLTDFYRDGRRWLRWDAVTDLYRAIDYEIRYGTNWDNAQLLGATPLTETPSIGDGSYMVRARAGSSYSENNASIVLFGSAIPRNIIVEYQEDALGWPGNVSGGAQVFNDAIYLMGADDLLDAPDVLAIDDIFFYDTVATSGAYTVPDGHIVNIGRVAPCEVLITLDMIGFSLTEDVLAIPDVLSVADILNGALGSKAKATPQIALAQEDGVFGAWQTYVPGEYVAQYFKPRVLLESTDPDVTAKLNSMFFSVDVPDLKRTYTNLLVPAEGLTITYPEPFNGGSSDPDKPRVQVTLLDALEGDQVVVTNSTLESFTLGIVNSGVGVERRTNVTSEGY